MLSIFNILTVARYEIKTLLRGWFFRVFAVFSIVTLVILNLLVLTDIGFARWMFRGIPSSIPYMNLLLLNVVQAVIAVFLASDFLKRDKKLDTTEVVYMRSMTNGDYVFGKTVGILFVFALLNLAVLLISAIFNLLITDVPFNPMPYIYYLLLLSIPTLIYIFGLSFLTMSLIRNQAVTFILLLGYIASTLFLFDQKLYHLFDYMAFNVPLLYSDFIGFGNLDSILLHRGIYTFLGLSFIFATVYLLKRLPQSRLLTRFSLVASILFFVAGLTMANIYVSKFSEGKNLRQDMVEINNKLYDEPVVSTLSSDIDLIHAGNGIQVKANLIIQNNTSQIIDRYIFSLNPGLTVQRVKADSRELDFTREMHILSVTPFEQLLPQTTDSLTISYSGTINEEASYLDVENAVREKNFHLGIINVDKRYAFVSADYVLLSPENLWYPIPGVTYSSNHPEYHNQEFVRFQLTVETKNALTVISQGAGTRLENGKYSFKPENPLTQLSLVIGPYEKRSIMVDSVHFNLFTLNRHNYFMPYFDELGDTLASIISELKQDYERDLNLAYPFPRLSLVEVPIQFRTYARMWTISRETVQPEMVWLPENGILLTGADFKQGLRQEQRRIERSNQAVLPQEIQRRIFNRFVLSTFSNSANLSRFFLARGAFAGRGRQGGGRNNQGSTAGATITAATAPILFGSPDISENDYSIYPNYYTFVNHLKSERWPILNIAFETYLKGGSNNLASTFLRGMTGLNDEEKANLALMDKSLIELLSDQSNREVAYNALKSKGNYLFTLIQGKIGTEEFQDFLNEILAEYKFQALDFETFNGMLQERFQLDLAADIEAWVNDRQLPGFLVSDVIGYKVLDIDRTRYQVKFKVTNPEPVGGLLVASFRTSGRGGFGGGDRGGRGRGGGRGFGGGGSQPAIEKIIQIGANETKEIGIVLDDMPRLMTINTLISQNLPAVLTRFFDEFELVRSAKPFDGQRILDYSISPTASDEIIVDNEDPGFKIFNTSSQSFLQGLVKNMSSQSEVKYAGIQFFQPSKKWQATTQSNFYGRYIHSAYYIESGNGDKKVAWNVVLPESGNYDVYSYTVNIRQRRFRGQSQNQTKDKYQFLVYHDDGVDEPIINLAEVENGWNFLGTYYFSADSAKVELTNNSEGRIVIADAVKWVKR